MQRQRRGFTLLELSIVIILVGLVAGMIMAGQELVRRQALHRMLEDASAYASAIQMFQQQYAALPGDMATATSVWGRADGGWPANSNCTDPTTAASNGKTTCNGDGNGVIDANNCENYRAWQQLAAANFIIGYYTGISGVAACAPNSVPDVNVPAGPIGKTAFSIASFGDGGTTYAPGQPNEYNNALIFGMVETNDYSIGPVLKTDDASEIDTKADDGNGFTGNIRAPLNTYNYARNCLDSTGVYLTTYTKQACSLIFLNSFLNHNNR